MAKKICSIEVILFNFASKCHLRQRSLPRMANNELPKYDIHGMQIKQYTHPEYFDKEKRQASVRTMEKQIDL